MSNCYAYANKGRHHSARRMQNSAILNVGVCTNPNRLNVAANDTPEPHACTSTDFDVANNCGVWCDKCRSSYARPYVFVGKDVTPFTIAHLG